MRIPTERETYVAELRWCCGDFALAGLGMRRCAPPLIISPRMRLFALVRLRPSRPVEKGGEHKRVAGLCPEVRHYDVKRITPCKFCTRGTTLFSERWIHESGRDNRFQIIGGIRIGRLVMAERADSVDPG